MSGTAGILTRTFVHVPGIGPATEKALWTSGISSWEKFLKSSSTIPASVRSRPSVYRFIERSCAALGKADIRFFAQHLPRQEWWRLYPHFTSRVISLDIETTGLSQYYDEITLVGVYDGRKVRTFLAGHNLERLSALLESYDIVITFNGTLFDIPFLRAKFPSLRLPPVHLDLRYVLKRLGHVGGLKGIEQKLGIKRSREVGRVDGLMATVLWGRYLRGDVGALELLVKYNTADIISLHSLMRYSCQQLTSRLLRNRRSWALRPRFERPKRVSVEVRRLSGSGIKLVVDSERTRLRAAQGVGPLVTVSDLLARVRAHLKNPKAVGIDLRASEIRRTGWAVLTGDVAETWLMKTDEEIIREAIRYDPDIISIDAPLTLPAGRCCAKDSCKCRINGITRECERLLWRRGVRVFPCLLPSMQKLTERGIGLAAQLRQLGYKVIESYPGAAQDIMRIARKKSSLDDLRRGLGDFGVRGRFLSEEVSHDELDAITSGVVGYFYLAGDFEPLGNRQEGYLIVPRLNRLPPE